MNNIHLCGGLSARSTTAVYNIAAVPGIFSTCICLAQKHEDFSAYVIQQHEDTSDVQNQPNWKTEHKHYYVLVVRTATENPKSVIAAAQQDVLQSTNSKLFPTIFTHTHTLVGGRCHLIVLEKALRPARLLICGCRHHIRPSAEVAPLETVNPGLPRPHACAFLKR